MTGLYPSRHGVFNNVDTNTAFQRGLELKWIEKRGDELVLTVSYAIENWE